MPLIKKFTSIIIVVSFFLVVLNSINYSQDNSKASEELVIKLQQKVLLNKNQTDQVRKFLNTFLSNPSEENRASLESNIESVLEEKQKMKYNIIKNDWFESVTKLANQNKE